MLQDILLLLLACFKSFQIVSNHCRAKFRETAFVMGMQRTFKNGLPFLSSQVIEKCLWAEEKSTSQHRTSRDIVSANALIYLFFGVICILRKGGGGNDNDDDCFEIWPICFPLISL